MSTLCCLRRFGPTTFRGWTAARRWHTLQNLPSKRLWRSKLGIKSLKGKEPGELASPLVRNGRRGLAVVKSRSFFGRLPAFQPN